MSSSIFLFCYIWWPPVRNWLHYFLSGRQGPKYYKWVDALCVGCIAQVFSFWKKNHIKFKMTQDNSDYHGNIYIGVDRLAKSPALILIPFRKFRRLKRIKISSACTAQWFWTNLSSDWPCASPSVLRPTLQLSLWINWYFSTSLQLQGYFFRISSKFFRDPRAFWNIYKYILYIKNSV